MDEIDENIEKLKTQHTLLCGKEVLYEKKKGESVKKVKEMPQK